MTKTVFISSVISGFEKYRGAAKAAVGIMDYTPIMAENFGARAYSSETACIKEVQSSNIFIVILGREYGHVTDEGISVTESEYRAARKGNKPILVFIQKCEMEDRQEEFKAELERYHDGFFRVTFSDEHELKDLILKGLRHLEKEAMSSNDQDFNKRIETALSENTASRSDPRGIVAFWGQPVAELDLDAIEESADKLFSQLSTIGVVKMSNGYKSKLTSKYFEIQSEKTRYAIYEDGLHLLTFSPEIEGKDYMFTMFHLSPTLFEKIACNAFSLCNSKIAWVLLGLQGMESRYFAEAEKGNSTSVPMFQQSSELVTKFFSPIVRASYEDWVKLQVKKFKRTFGKKSN